MDFLYKFSCKICLVKYSNDKLLRLYFILKIFDNVLNTIYKV